MEMFLPLPRRVAKHSIRLQPTSHALPEEEDVVRNENKREFHSERTMRIFADYYLERLLRRLLLPSLTAGVLTITCCKWATFICLTFNCCSAETRPPSRSLPEEHPQTTARSHNKREPNDHSPVQQMGIPVVL